MAGSLVTSTATFKDGTGTAADPTAVVLKYLEPGGTVTSVTYPNAFITKVSTGVYSAAFDTTAKPGTWIVQWDGTGNVQAIDSATFPVTAATL